MLNKFLIWFGISVFAWIFTSMFALFFFNSDTTEKWRIIFQGYGVTCILLLLIGLVMIPCYEVFRRKNSTLLRLSIFFWPFITMVIVINFGSNSIIVAREGWISIYKHPLLWLLLLSIVINLLSRSITTKEIN